ncbi:hypothetical protein IKP85_05910 [bacterium]|nr:hypothetical protein [bacterium]
MKKKLFLLSCVLMLSGSAALAYDSYNIKGATYSYVMNFYDKGEEVECTGMDEEMIGAFHIYDNYRIPLFESAKNWSTVINGMNAKKPVSYSIYAIDDYNAMAASLPTNVAELPYKVTHVNAVINNLTKTSTRFPASLPTDGLIAIGKGVDSDNPGWSPFTGFHSLYHGELSDFNAVITHEIMHSLGLTSYANTFNEDEGDKTTYFSMDKNDSLGIFDKDFRIYTGDMSLAFNSDLEVKPEKGMAIKKGGKFDIFKYSPYYVGQETLKVLAGKEDYDDARQAIIDNGGFVNYSSKYKVKARPSVYGMPIHPMDGTDEEFEIDLSHTELRNSYMSHQEFRNWLVPMEAELAILKDIGYNIDLRRYFGKSYYLNGITDTFTTGYSEWNGSAYTGNPSKVTQGVGLHIYGDNNNITQASNISTVGEGAFGVRIDGEGNTYTLSSGSKINADGKENIALGVTWGQNHIVNVESGSTVTAKGKDGIAASFDFGANLFGTLSDVRGSYINYSNDYDINGNPEKSTQAELVTDFNVSGTLEGKKAAIYISNNAHVKNINLLNGAKINGDIISEWNSISSGKDAKVMVEKELSGIPYWTPINPSEDELYYTVLNTTGDVEINGNINGDNGIYNTLKMKNIGVVDFNGDEISANTINNNGIINIYNPTDVTVQDGYITGLGDINVLSSGSLSFDSGIKEIKNTINLENKSFLSVMNDVAAEVKINQINSDNAKISFDLGDVLNLGEAPDAGSSKAGILQVKVDKDTAEDLEDNTAYKLFADAGNSLDLGTSKANVYYGGNKYTLSQIASSKDLLGVKLTAKGVELKDAAEDSTAANYIVTEDKLTKDAGTVKGNEFEISGKDIDVNGHKGLVIDGKQNKGGTILKTGISGASDSNLTVKNGGELAIIADEKNIEVGNKGKTAIRLNNGQVLMNSGENNISIKGAIKGSDNKKDIVTSSGKQAVFSDTENVGITADNEVLYLNGKSKNTVWNLNSQLVHVTNEAGLASDGSNEIVFGGGAISLANNKATDITLSKMTLTNNLATTLDVDIKNLSADRFVFKKSSDLNTNGNLLVIAKANLINTNAALTDEKYSIPVVSKSFHNEKFLSGIISGVKSSKIMTPVFKYNMDFVADENMAGFELTRGNSSDYNNYNPAIMTGPIAAQLGGYLSQLNSYDEAFRNLDMKMLLTREERKAFKMANRYASAEKPQVFSETYLPEKDSAGWFRPYASFEKVGLKNGPRVGNIMYGSYFGGDSDMYETKNGWDYQYSLYGSYNGSHQYYAGNSIYQNGGNLGATGIWYKGDFFTALTANVGASVADASTMYGSEDIPMLMSGVASKTGFNWELAKGKFIIQPSYMMSYSFVNTFDYHNAAGVKINADPLHAINITPGIKFIGNLKHGWQPYMGVQMVWNIMDKTDFKAQSVSLPDMSVKPYVQYGVGLQKRWGERFTGFGQVMMRNGGRNGVALSAGFRWAIGKDKKQSKNKAEETKAPKTIKKMNSHNSPKQRNIARYNELISGS